MSKTKSVEYWEIKKGFIVVAKDIKPETSMTEEEFDLIPLHDKVGVNHSDRTKFLEANGYEVTRENMINSALSDRVTPDEEIGEELVDQLKALEDTPTDGADKPSN